MHSDGLNSQHDFLFFLFQALNGERIPKNQKDKAHFISKYEGRKNGGIPCFAEERSVERAAKVFLLAQLSSILFDSMNILGHRIRISDILPWDRKSYLTQAILPRLSREGYIHWLYWNLRTWSSSDVIVIFK